MSKLSDAELVKLQLHRTTGSCGRRGGCCRSGPRPGSWRRERRTPCGRSLTDDTDVSRRLRALWALEAIGRLTPGGRERRCIATQRRGSPGVGCSCAPTYTGDRDVGEAFTLGEALRTERRPSTSCSRSPRRCSSELDASHGVRPDPGREAVGKDPTRNCALAVWYRVADELDLRPGRGAQGADRTDSPIIRRNSVRFLLSGPKSR